VKGIPAFLKDVEFDASGLFHPMADSPIARALNTLDGSRRLTGVGFPIGSMGHAGAASNMD
jgi:hypothetical protein